VSSVRRGEATTAEGDTGCCVKGERLNKGRHWYLGDKKRKQWKEGIHKREIDVCKGGLRGKGLIGRMGAREETGVRSLMAKG